MARPECKVCSSLEQDAWEAIASEAVRGAISWREAGRQTGLNPRSLQNHMEKHVLAPEEAARAAEENDEFDELIQTARAELLEHFQVAASDIKPIILVAIRNLESLKQTKPSAETLVKALKTIQEMTGMKQEQRLMLEYAAAQQRRRLRVVNANEPKALEA